MNKRILPLLTLTALVCLSSITRAQHKSPALSDVEDRFVNAVEQQLPGWSHKTVKPIQGSGDVVINQWTSGEKAVSVTLIRHSSQEEAVKKIHQFTEDIKASKVASESGDEQYVVGAQGSIVLRKHQFTINIDVQTNDPDDEKHLIKQFARLVADAIK
jgi:hypothetical protein